MSNAFNLEVLDFNGTWIIDSSRSDSLDESLKLQGYGWMFRKLVGSFADGLVLTIRYDERGMHQHYASSLK